MGKRLSRSPIQYPVVFKRLDQEEPAQTGTGWTEDLGEGGACLKLPIPLLRGCQVGLVILSEPEVVELEARVVWVRAGGQRAFYYHGVEFIHITPFYYQSLLKALARSKSAEQRIFRRFPLEIPVSCRALKHDAPSVEGQIRDVSRGGALIALSQQLLPRTEVEITIERPGADPVPGKVQWVADSEDDSGLFPHGIEFLGGPLENHVFLCLFSDTSTEP
jgi:c-di-GMP-binding flagellar brake protein YcgR